ncbi:hypothetical protein MTR67_006913 [Solanum verrucosum]|uniref:Uncharacterized protein n=1 Tax=Solanum verrucosum TaxID=315347 RepID=A0AAF0PYR8_SOLVR|nr:hypothetical protein MTR67_006913 [Solanum verrucosum]
MSCGATHDWQEVCPKKVLSKGSPSQATSWIVVMTTGHRKTHGVALSLGERCHVEGATGQGTTCTTTGHGALDEARSRGHALASWEVGKLEEATAKGSMGTTTRHGALDEGVVPGTSYLS